MKTPVFTLEQIDQIQYEMAQMAGRPLPDLPKFEAALTNAILSAEAMGYTVICRPHSFGGRFTAGGANHDEKRITLFVHPDYSQEDSARNLYHELGHLHQDPGHYGRQTVEGYFACERDATRRGFQLAEAWGQDYLFPPEIRQKQADWEDLQESIATGLATIAGTNDAFILVKLSSHLRGIVTDRCLKDSSALAPYLEDGYLSAEGLDNLVWGHPAILVGFDRSQLRDSWTLPYSGAASEPLPLKKSERALFNLVSLIDRCNGHWSYAGENSPFKRPRLAEEVEFDEGVKTIVTSLEGHYYIGEFIKLVQAIVTSATQERFQMTWWVTPELGVYEVICDWPDSPERPAWRCHLLLGSRRSHPEEDALKLYINSFRHVCHIGRRHPDEYINYQAWLTSSIVGDVPAAWLSLPYNDADIEDGEGVELE